MKRVYLDEAAAAPVLPKALRAFVRASRFSGNPSAQHEEGRAAKEILDDARSTIARLTGAKSEYVTFTSGATEANALAIVGVYKALQRKGVPSEKIHMLCHPGAHASVVKTMNALKEEGVQVGEVSHIRGAIDCEGLKKQLRPETALVSLEAVSPETGMRFDTRAVRRVLDEVRAHSLERILLHIDASQLPLIESVERTRLGADLMTLDAQKVGGVRGIGALIRASGVPLAPIISGGGQERGMRGGTESPALASAFAVALSEVRLRKDIFVKHATALRIQLLTDIRKTIPGVEVQGGKNGAPHILSLSLRGRDTDYLVALLDEAGFALSTKSACEAGEDSEGRMVFSETGDHERAKATLRISWGGDTTQSDLRRFSRALVRAVAFLDQHTP